MAEQRDGFRVNARQCSTCIFGPRSPISEARFEDLRQQWESRGIVQQCHHSTMSGGDVACRGHFEAFRRGETVNHPVRSIARTLGLDVLTDAELAELFIGMGLIQFTEVDDE